MRIALLLAYPMNNPTFVLGDSFVPGEMASCKYRTPQPKGCNASADASP